MKLITDKLKGKKTYITALGAMLVAIGGYLTGEIEMGQAVTLGFEALLAVFIRVGIKTDVGEGK